jgi:hypothetical protein
MGNSQVERICEMRKCDRIDHVNNEERSVMSICRNYKNVFLSAR